MKSIVKKLITNILFVSITVIFSSCSNYNNGYKADSAKTSYVKIAKEKYSDNINYMFSPDSSFVVCYKTEKLTTDNPTSQIKFFIYNLKDEKIIFEDKSRSHKIEWLNNTRIQVFKRPGIISVDPKKNLKMLGYIFDVNQNKKLPLSDTGKNKLQ